jgi:hypothetical protein
VGALVCLHVESAYLTSVTEMRLQQSVVNSTLQPTAAGWGTHAAAPTDEVPSRMTLSRLLHQSAVKSVTMVWVCVKLSVQNSVLFCSLFLLGIVAVLTASRKARYLVSSEYGQPKHEATCGPAARDQAWSHQ